MRETNFSNTRNLYFFASICTLFILYSASQINKVSYIHSIRFLDFKLSGTPDEILNSFVVSFPYLIVIILILLSFFYYSKQIDRTILRRMYRLIMIAGLVIFFLLFSHRFSTPPPTTSPGVSQTTAVSTTYPTTNFPPTSVVTVTVSKSLQGHPIINANFNVINIFLIILLSIIIIFFFARTKKILKFEHGSKKEEEVKNKNREINDPNKIAIIKEYLELSKILESLGINPDFSLTPFEFHDETTVRLDFEEFQQITYFYELARFSDDKITDEEFNKFKSNLESIYNKISKIKAYYKTIPESG